LGRISGIGSTGAGARLREAGIDPERRAQTLDLAEWETLYRAFNPEPGR
jgi:ribosomal protein S13